MTDADRPAPRRPVLDAAPSSEAPGLAECRAMLQALVAEHGVPADAAPGRADPGSLTRIPAASAATWGLDWPVPADARPSAVLILFGALDDVPADRSSRAVHPNVDVLLTQRAATLRQHAGQVAFPGGRVDPEDQDVVATALREAQEETGLDPAGVDVVGVLPPVPVSVSGHVVHPVIGWWRRATDVAVVDHGEAAAVFRLPVADLVDPDHRVRVARPGGRRGITPGFLAGDRLVWGFTAALLDRLLHLLGWDEPWDGTRVVDAATHRPVTR